MAAILRLAGGLDRSNTQQVQSLAITRQGKETELGVIATRYPELDIWGARRRVEMFEDVFGTRLKIEWRPEAEAAPSGGSAEANGSPRRGA